MGASLSSEPQGFQPFGIGPSSGCSIRPRGPLPLGRAWFFQCPQQPHLTRFHGLAIMRPFTLAPNNDSASATGWFPRPEKERDHVRSISR